MLQTRDMVKFWLGSVLEIMAPWITQDLDRGQHLGRFIKAKRWILFARTTRARAKGDASGLQKSLFQFWRTDTADAYFDQYLDRYETWFLGGHHEIVDQLADLSQSGAYNRLVEVGCGAGRVLEHCASAMPEVKTFVGVDINPSVIASNKAKFAQNPRLQFQTADACIWLKDTAQPGTILMTYGGVMEYFSGSALAAMFRTLAKAGPAAVALMEPVDPAHDLAHDSASHAFGQENSFSHNHQKLLEATGYDIVFRKTLVLGGASWVMLVATVGKELIPL